MTRVAALIGTGMVARTHLLALRDAPGVQLGAVVARRAESAERFADLAQSETGARPRVLPDASAVADDPDIDLAIIVTPPDARIDLITPLAAAGKPILLEKPIGRDLAEAAELVELCDGAGVPLGIFFQHRAREASLTAKALIEGGTLGSLGLVEVSVPWWRDQAYYDEPGRGSYARDGGGVLISQAIHTIDLTLWLAGPVTEVTAMTATTRFHRMEAEDIAAAGLHFEGGALGWLTASTASFPGGAESIVLQFDHGSLRLAEGTLTVHWRDGRTETRGGQATGTGGGADPMAFTHGWHQSVLEDFLDTLDTGSPLLASGRSALAAHAVIEAITQSARRGHPMPVEPL